MDAFILLGSFFVLILIGTPVAYAMGMAALIGAWWRSPTCWWASSAVACRW